MSQCAGFPFYDGKNKISMRCFLFLFLGQGYQNDKAMTKKEIKSAVKNIKKQLIKTSKKGDRVEFDTMLLADDEI